MRRKRGKETYLPPSDGAVDFCESKKTKGEKKETFFQALGLLPLALVPALSTERFKVILTTGGNTCITVWLIKNMFVPGQ